MIERSDFHIVVEPDTFLLESVDMLGVIYLQVGSKAFPGMHWDDFVVAILGGWIETIIQLIESGDDQCQLMFMDGPFSVHVVESSDDSWTLRCVARHANRTEIEIAFQLEPNALLDELEAAASLTSTRCEELGWDSRDLSRLVEWRDQLVRQRPI